MIKSVVAVAIRSKRTNIGTRWWAGLLSSVDLSLGLILTMRDNGNV